MDTADIEAKVLEFIASKVEHVDASRISILHSLKNLGLIP